MIEEAKQTGHWLWGIIRNPDIVWTDANTGEEALRERWKRSARWHTLKPIWMFYALTTNPGCGCRRRFGLWHTIWCSEHAANWMEDDK